MGGEMLAEDDYVFHWINQGHATCDCLFSREILVLKKKSIKYRLIYN